MAFLETEEKDAISLESIVERMQDSGSTRYRQDQAKLQSRLRDLETGEIEYIMK